MKKDYTHISFIIDRSSSMSVVWKETIQAIKDFIKSQKTEPGECTFSLTFFNNEINFPIDFVSLDQITNETIRELKLYPDGLTALIDAVCMTIKRTGNRLAEMDEQDRPDKVMIVTQTDGMENNSSEYSPKDVVQMVKEQQEKYSWNFMFLGATDKSVEAAFKYGFSRKSSVRYSKDRTDGAFDVISKKMLVYRKSCRGSEEFKNAVEFSESDKEEMN